MHPRSLLRYAPAPPLTLPVLSLLKIEYPGMLTSALYMFSLNQVLVSRIPMEFSSHKTSQIWAALPLSLESNNPLTLRSCSVESFSFSLSLTSGSGELPVGIVEVWAEVSSSSEAEAGFEVEVAAETTSSLLKKSPSHCSSQGYLSSVSFY